MNYHPSWKPLFDLYDFDLDQLSQPYYPPKHLVFRVFQKSVYDLKVCLIGQDPYHGEGQANGLSFSVNEGVKIPPSLKNIFKEINLEFPKREYEFTSGNLDVWLDQENIFLLNASLTVEKGNAGSHMKIWSEFTDDVIKFISEQNNKCVFLLLGNFAKDKKKFITHGNPIVEAPHPSPLAQGFIGSGVFRKIEAILGHQIDWSN